TQSGLPGSSGHGCGGGGAESPGGASDGQLRPAVESEQDRAAFRSGASDRPAAGVAAVGSGGGADPAGAGGQGGAGEDGGAASGVRGKALRCAGGGVSGAAVAGVAAGGDPLRGPA